ncbi:MAG: thioesterase family protein [Actinomycetia bacterium]|nr:thioesterase family protein [Actinomycetes bacterium]
MSEFDDATRVSADGAAAIHDGWDINGNANGGYLLALAASRLRAVSGSPDPLSVTGHYLAPGTPGPVQIDATTVKSGRRFNTVTGQMHRDGKPILQATGVFGDLSQMTDDFTHIVGGPPEMPPMDECVPRSPVQGVAHVALNGRLNVRLRPGDESFMRGERKGDAEMAGWFSFADGRPVDTLALLLACDAFPPAVFHIDLPPGWVPTLEYTVHVRAVPAPGPVRCVFRTHFVQGGFFNEDGEVWDSQDRLVAQSRQLGLTPLG